jgi:hypothetical protein
MSTFFLVGTNLNPLESSGNSENSGKTKTQKKSTNTGKKFTPNEGRNRWLDQYIIKVKDDIMNNLKRDFKNNMTKQEAKTMNDLLNDDTIILRPSDNGSGIAVMDADKYKDEIESDLNDNTTYKQIDDRVINHLFLPSFGVNFLPVFVLFCCVLVLPEFSEFPEFPSSNDSFCW